MQIALNDFSLIDKADHNKIYDDNLSIINK